MSRACGPCSLCCTTLGVAELNKPPGVRCRHLGPRGCTIYDQRPDDCRAFECLWLQRDAIPTNLRPDKCGAVFGASEEGTHVVLYIDPQRPRAMRKGRLRTYLRGLERKGVTTIPYFIGNTLKFLRSKK